MSLARSFGKNTKFTLATLASHASACEFDVKTRRYRRKTERIYLSALDFGGAPPSFPRDSRALSEH